MEKNMEEGKWLTMMKRNEAEKRETKGKESSFDGKE